MSTIELNISFSIKPYELDILIKSFDFFKNTSLVFDNEEQAITIDEVRSKIMNNLVQVAKSN